MTNSEANRYPIEVLDEDDDDGTMPENVAELASAVVGKRIVRAEEGEWKGKYWGRDEGLILTLDDGRKVLLANSDDCCAFTAVGKFFLNPELVDHVITGVGTTGGYTQWHIYAHLGDVMQLEVGWSCGNPFYYGYGFTIDVIDDLRDATVPTREIEGRDPAENS
jgi:hypothetical protein